LLQVLGWPKPGVSNPVVEPLQSVGRAIRANVCRAETAAPDIEQRTPWPMLTAIPEMRGQKAGRCQAATSCRDAARWPGRGMSAARTASTASANRRMSRR
jgi:hypothetical protein